MQYIQITHQDRIGHIILNRPEKRNALSHELVSELKQAFTEMQDDKNIKVIVLRANGNVFCAGADLGYIRQLQAYNFDQNLEDSFHLKELFSLIYTLSKPVIAQVQGHAIAGGAGLAAVCDFVISAPEAMYGFSEVKIGFVPALVSVFLVRKIGEGRAREMLLSGQIYQAAQALQYGMIHKIVPAENLEKEVLNFAGILINQNSGQAMALTKQMLSEFAELGLEEALKSAARYNAMARGTDDCKNGIAAFLNKEPMNW
jgi:methylglutaconyl-CoA hydratase